MFDEQPDGDPHGECAAEIHNLRHLRAPVLRVQLMKFGARTATRF